MKARRLVESLKSWGVGLLVAAAHWAFCFPAVPRNAQDVFSDAINLSGIAIGFLGTAQGLVMAMANTRLMREIRKAGMHGQLLGHFKQAITLAFLLVFISLLARFVSEAVLPYIMPFFFGAMSAALWSSGQVVTYSWAILDSDVPPAK